MTRIVPVTLVEEEEEHHRVLYFYIQTQRLSRMKRNQIIKNQQLLYIIYHRATTMRWACVCVCVLAVLIFVRSLVRAQRNMVHSVVLVVDDRGQGMIRMNDESHDNGNDVDNDTRGLHDDVDDSVSVLDCGTVGDVDMCVSSFDRMVSHML